MAPYVRIPKTTRKELKPTERAYIHGMRSTGASYSTIHRATGTPIATIARTLKNIPNREDYKSLPRSHLRVTDDRSDWRLVRESKTHRRMTLREISTYITPEISRSTLKRRLRELNIKKWLAAQRLLLTEAHKAQRLQ